ncbi:MULTISPECIES: hypothetical protein [Vibrio]|uniref:hypothetical protein n=1 Tax=Vibrio TaxID=662 RepID=UPI00067FFDC2|nr:MULTISPECIES: hypothetical protein [Vibrio]EIE1271966.1 hypothetical protein [Vibrio parahaemolyticus]MDF4597606.1 hypothetical protein [Vibrio parahaemolyticus]MDW2327809.1 hypothetical protein [Vibrio sp. 1401]PNM52235.1 hypothetical protein AL469_009275 [Vibrio harveyi]HCM0869859.1 hypothetical protein [Vibrio parahaemolyticus]
MNSDNLSESPSEEVTCNEPLFVKGGVEGEPVKYLGVKPYELDKYEFSILKKKFENKSVWFNAALGATAGSIFLLLAKVIQLSLTKQEISIEIYEIATVLLGAIASWNLRTPTLSDDELEQQEIVKYIDDWFSQNPKRNIHVSPKRGRS